MPIPNTCEYAGKGIKVADDANWIVSVPVSSLSIPEDETPLGKQYCSNILDHLHCDAIGKVCRQDEFITQMGKSLYVKGKD